MTAVRDYDISTWQKVRYMVKYHINNLIIIMTNKKQLGWLSNLPDNMSLGLNKWSLDKLSGQFSKIWGIIRGLRWKHIALLLPLLWSFSNVDFV